jgi:hypothetical protein
MSLLKGSRGAKETPEIVIASEAKQSSKWDSDPGLLRRFAPRNDDQEGRPFLAAATASFSTS